MINPQMVLQFDLHRFLNFHLPLWPTCPGLPYILCRYILGLLFCPSFCQLIDNNNYYQLTSIYRYFFRFYQCDCFVLAYRIKTIKKSLKIIGHTNRRTCLTRCMRIHIYIFELISRNISSIFKENVYNLARDII